MKSDEYHMKVAYLPEKAMVEILQWWQNPIGRKAFQLVHRGEPLPEGTRVGAVFPRGDRRAIAVRLHHPSFPVVTEGQAIPEWEDMLEMELVGVCCEVQPSPAEDAAP